MGGATKVELMSAFTHHLGKDDQRAPGTSSTLADIQLWVSKAYQRRPSTNPLIYVSAVLWTCFSNVILPRENRAGYRLLTADGDAMAVIDAVCE